MAESISPWMAASIVNACCERRFTSDDVVDMPYVPGAKVQITRILGYEADEAPAKASIDDDLGIVRKSALWAIAGDRAHEVLIRFSPECVTWFDNCHSRELITLSRAVIVLLSFRPSLSSTGSRLLSGQSGPFARVEAPRLFLDVTAMHVVGVPSDVVYWVDTRDLQDALSLNNNNTEGDAKQARRFRRWLVAARRSLAERGGRQRSSGQRRKIVQESSRNMTASAEQTSFPPPFQNQQRKRRRQMSASSNASEHVVVANDSIVASLTPAESHSPKDAWGDYTLAVEEADLFGSSLKVGERTDRATSNAEIDSPGEEALNLDLLSAEPFEKSMVVRQLGDIQAADDALIEAMFTRLENPADPFTTMRAGAGSVDSGQMEDGEKQAAHKVQAREDDGVERPTSRQGARAKVTRRITVEEREQAKREYESILARMHGAKQ